MLPQNAEPTYRCATGHLRGSVGPVGKQRSRLTATELCEASPRSASCDKLQAVKAEREAAEMNQPNALSDDAFGQPAQDELAIDRPRASGFVLQKINVPAALAVLDSFLEEDEAEQHETFEYLKRALDESREAHGERPVV